MEAVPYSDSLLSRYRGVCALASRGVDGEQSNARKMKRTMESEYPGIAHEAAKPPPPPEPPPDAADGNFGQAPRWAKWGRAAESAFAWAAGVAQEAASLDYAVRCADTFADIATRMLPSGKWQIAVKIPQEDLHNCAEYLTDAQKRTFANYIAHQIAEQLLYVLQDDEEEF